MVRHHITARARVNNHSPIDAWSDYRTDFERKPDTHCMNHNGSEVLPIVVIENRSLMSKLWNQNHSVVPKS
uniref:Transposase n=1 Tax=Panagrellus redivivus TaxID=6233 RepID=A0A7E4VYZ7_PANRE